MTLVNDHLRKGRFLYFQIMTIQALQIIALLICAVITIRYLYGNPGTPNINIGPFGV